MPLFLPGLLESLSMRTLALDTDTTILAGVVGIEPTLTVLETAVLPLYDTPSKQVNTHRLRIINYEELYLQETYPLDQRNSF